MSKKRKIIIVLVIALLLIASSGYAYNQHLVKQQEELVLATENLYKSLETLNIEGYNNKELERYNTLLASREQHFAVNDLNTLMKVQNRLTTLNETATTRIEKEAAELQAKYDSKKDEVNIIKVVDGANEQEINIFNTRKNSVLKQIEEKAEFETIDNAITTLKNTNSDINTRIENDRIAQEQANRNWTGGGWSDDNYVAPEVHNPAPVVEEACRYWGIVRMDQVTMEMTGGGTRTIDYPVYDWIDC